MYRVVELNGAFYIVDSRDTIQSVWYTLKYAQKECNVINNIDGLNDKIYQSLLNDIEHNSVSSAIVDLRETEELNRIWRLN